jgi:hypothetical protein
VSPGVILRGRRTHAVCRGSVRCDHQPEHQRLQWAVQCRVCVQRHGEHQPDSSAVWLARCVLPRGVCCCDPGHRRLLLVGGHLCHEISAGL